MKIIIPRAVLAVLVALLMSIPLELIVFEDIINSELPNYESKKLQDASRIGYEADNSDKADRYLDQVTSQQNITEKNVASTGSALESAKEKKRDIQNRITAAEGRRNNPNTSRHNAAYRERERLNGSLRNSNLTDQQRSAIRSKISGQTAIINDERGKWNAKINEEISRLNDELKSVRSELESKRSAYENAERRKNEVDNLVIEATKVKNDADADIRGKTAKIDSIQKRTNRFILHYSVLEYAVYDKVTEKIAIPKAVKPKEEKAAQGSVSKGSKGEGETTAADVEYEYKEVEHFRNPDALMMLWLIRVLFFVFEMMPTVVKAVSKPGPYERECEAQDSQMASFFTSTMYMDHMQTLLKDKLDHEKRLADDRMTTEKELHDQILTKIKNAQHEVAIDAIDRWRAEQLGGSIASENGPRLASGNGGGSIASGNGGSGATGLGTQGSVISVPSQPMTPAADSDNDLTTEGDEFD